MELLMQYCEITSVLCIVVLLSISQMASAGCSTGWKVTGNYIPSEKDFKGQKVDLVVQGQKYQFREDFIKDVRLQGDGNTDYGWILHCCWHKVTKIIGACNKELETMKSVARDPSLMKCGTNLEIKTTYLSGKTFVAHDTEQITTEMAKRYCGEERTIILCVIPANIDLSTSEALKYAKDWDEKIIRTLSVITKLDIMDAGTNAKKALLNQEVFLKLGFVGVKNRSQQDILDKVKVQSGLLGKQ